MKILFLGYHEYLANILYHLNGTRFIDENKIDVIFAAPRSNINFRKLKSVTLKKLIIRFHLKLLKKRHAKIISELFPSPDVDYLNSNKNINVLEYNGLENINNLASYDYMIVCSFGEKIPSEIFNKPKFGTLNIHPSFLPNLRGGYPTYVEAYFNKGAGGTTIHKINEDFDRGEILEQVDYKVDESFNNSQRYLLSAKYAAYLLNILHEKSFSAQFLMQRDEISSNCRKVLKPKLELKSIHYKDNLTGYIQANYSKHLYPFTHDIVDMSLLSVLKVENEKKISKKLDKKKVRVYKYDSFYYINFYGECYKVIKYIKNGIVHNV